MLKKSFLGLFAITSIFAVHSCKESGKKVGKEYTTEAGLKYEYYKVGEGKSPDSTNQIMTMHMVYKTDKDSVLFDSRKQDMPIAVRFDDANLHGMLAEGFKMLQEGDSVRFVIPTQDFFFQTAKMPVPEGLDEKGTLIFNVGVQDVLTEQDYMAQQTELMKKQQEKAMEQQKVQLTTDVEKITDYLAQKNIKADTTESGIRYAITQKGKGPKPNAGDTVKVHYKGTLLDGTAFDSSYDRGEPLEFVVGRGQVIRGWDEGLMLLNEGGKATLYIPSPLAYGSRGAGGVIPPNAVLVFEVELVDVAPAK